MRRIPPGPSLSNPAWRAPSIFIRSDQVAMLLGYASSSSFRNQRLRLEEEGFPEPARKIGRILWWRRAEVVAWLNRPPAPVEGVPDLSAADLAVDRAVMLRMARMA